MKTLKDAVSTPTRQSSSPAQTTSLSGTPNSSAFLEDVISREPYKAVVFLNDIDGCLTPGWLTPKLLEFHKKAWLELILEYATGSDELHIGLATNRQTVRSDYHNAKTVAKYHGGETPSAFWSIAKFTTMLNEHLRSIDNPLEAILDNFTSSDFAMQRHHNKNTKEFALTCCSPETGLYPEINQDTLPLYGCFDETKLYLIYLLIHRYTLKIRSKKPDCQIEFHFLDDSQAILEGLPKLLHCNDDNHSPLLPEGTSLMAHHFTCDMSSSYYKNIHEIGYIISGTGKIDQSFVMQDAPQQLAKYHISIKSMSRDNVNRGHAEDYANFFMTRQIMLTGNTFILEALRLAMREIIKYRISITKPSVNFTGKELGEVNDNLQASLFDICEAAQAYHYDKDLSLFIARIIKVIDSLFVLPECKASFSAAMKVVDQFINSNFIFEEKHSQKQLLILLQETFDSLYAANKAPENNKEDIPKSSATTIFNISNSASSGLSELAAADEVDIQPPCKARRLA